MENINKLLYGIIGLWMCLAIFFGFFDLEISKFAVTYKNSLWSELGDDYGNKFVNSLFYLAITILIGSIFNDIKMQRKIGVIMILYAIALLQYTAMIKSNKYLFEPIIMIITLVTFLFLTFNKNWRDLVPMAISLILIIIILDFTVSVMKLTWGRTRFNNLSSDVEFTEWYVINGNGTDHSRQSFPSGHTAAAWSFLPLLFLVKNKEIDKKIKLSLIMSIIGFGLFVAISRVIRGSHYASDVLFSTGLASLLTIFFYKTFNSKDFGY